MGVPPEHAAEEGGAGGEDHLVGLDLFIITGQGHIEEVFVVPQFTERCGDVRLEIVPPQAELFRSHVQAETFLDVFRSSIKSSLFILHI